MRRQRRQPPRQYRGASSNVCFSILKLIPPGARRRDPVAEPQCRVITMTEDLRRRESRMLYGRPLMSDAGAKLTLLEQRRIEARIVGPLVAAVRAELGTEKTLALLRRVIADLARQSGA